MVLASSFLFPSSAFLIAPLGKDLGERLRKIVSVRGGGGRKRDGSKIPQTNTANSILFCQRNICSPATYFQEIEMKFLSQQVLNAIEFDNIE